MSAVNRCGPRGAAAALAIAAIAAVTVPTAVARDGGEKTRIMIKKISHKGASGKLSSRSERCLKRRKVTLFRIDDYVSVKVKITQSNARGRWKVKKNLKRARYFAKVDAIKGCRYDVSTIERLR
ncbi:MAG TPA: hypothetical protein VK326_03835 [Solirubrobacterales bacterium]|nr:hypothetical protein [Solirubrobacterales bacterium]